MTDIGDQQKAASEEAARAEAIRSLAQTLNNDGLDTGCKLIKGVVTAVATTTLSAQLGGDTSTTIDGIRYFDSYSPVVGDVIQVLKQGSDIVALGEVNNSNSQTQNGWVQPTLSTGFSHSSDFLKYRVVNDHGDLKLQFRGSVTASGVTYTANVATLFTLPAGARPSLNCSFLVPRDSGGLVCKINIIASTGVVQVDNMIGVRSGIEGGGAATSSSQHGNLAGTTVDLQHYHNTNGVDSTGVIYNGVGGAMYGGNPHYHITNSATHSHLGGDHQHNLALNAPSALWFTALELFL